MKTSVPSSLEEATRVLIDNLLVSEAFLRYRRSQNNLDADPKARGLLRQVSEAQSRLRRGQSTGSVTQAEIEALRELQQSVQRNRAILEFAHSQQEAVAFLREINAEINSMLGINFASFANCSTC